MRFSEKVGLSLVLVLFTMTLSLIGRDVEAPRASANSDGNKEFRYAYESIQLANYSWLGYRWREPDEVPHLFPWDIQGLFRSENTIWLGDKSGLTEYQTMHDLMNSPNLHNIRGSELHVNTMKHSSPGYSYNSKCRHRVSNDTSWILDLGHVGAEPINCTDSNSTNGVVPESLGKFDLVNGTTTGLRDLSSMVKNHRLDFQDYSLLVVSAGDDDILNMPANRSELGVINSELKKSLVEALNALHEISGPSLFVIWKTSWPFILDNYNDERQRIEEFAETARDWFQEKKPKYMDIADFGSAMTKGGRRSGHVANRKELNMYRTNPSTTLHFRLLIAQIISHAKYMKDRRDNPKQVC